MLRQLARPLALVIGGATVITACAKVPYTNRAQFNGIPAGIMNAIGSSTYNTMIADTKLVQSGDDLKLLKSVGQRIADQTGENYDWEYKLVQSDSVNAWCLPGGKIAFYTGVLPALQSEAGMAFVMGHEVGHAVAHHSAERLSQQAVLFGGLIGLFVVVDKNTDLTTEQNLAIQAALGVATEVGVILPFSRMHESEADVIGAMYMAGAGYPPQESLEVWDRMEALSPSSIPTFLSTHPSNEARQDALRDWMPQAGKRYARNKLPGDTQVARWGARSGSPATPSGKPGVGSSATGGSVQRPD